MLQPSRRGCGFESPSAGAGGLVPRKQGPLWSAGWCWRLQLQHGTCVHACARDRAGDVIQGHMRTLENKYRSARPFLRALAPLLHRRRGPLWGSDGFISVPRRGDRPRRVSPRERLPQPRLCPTGTGGEKRSNSAENAKLPDRENIATGTRFGGSNKGPNGPQTWCPPCPRGGPSVTQACLSRTGSIPDAFPIAKLIRMCTGSTGTRCYSVEVFPRERAY